MIKLPYELLIYDIETSLLKANVFRLGEQRITHKQLDVAHKENNIICIAAKWYGKSKVYMFDGEDKIERFDELARKADVCLGKNSDSFDVKYINTARMMQGLKPYPEWMDTNDDLQKQMKKYFAFPSQSLDYISNIFGTGGKEQMEFQDWVDINNYKQLKKFEGVGFKIKQLEHTSSILFKDKYKSVILKGNRALEKMKHYNKKDVLDTEAALIKVLPYIKLKYNSAAKLINMACTTCGSQNIFPTKKIVVGKTKYQQFNCLQHNGYAGRATYRYNQHRNKVYGKIS